MKTIIKRTYHSYNQPIGTVRGFTKRAKVWRGTVQVLTDEDNKNILHIKNDVRALAMLVLRFHILQFRIIYLVYEEEKHSNIGMDYQTTRKEKVSVMTTAKKVAERIRENGGEIIYMMVDRPPVLPDDIGTENIIHDDFLHLFTPHTYEIKWNRLIDRIIRSRRTTNIPEWRNTLDWVIRQMNELNPHKNQL